MAADQLGGWRFGARGELRALPRLLGSEERVLGMALGWIGNWHGRLFVATDSRLLLVSKPTLRHARCTEIPYEEIEVSHAVPREGVCELCVVASGERQSWHLVPAERGERFSRLLAERNQRAAVEHSWHSGWPTVSDERNIDSRAAAGAVRSGGRPTACPRCGERGAARWCETCGLDFIPDQPRPPSSESCAASQREHRWLIEHPDVAAAERQVAAAEREVAAAEHEAARKPEPTNAAGQPQDRGGRTPVEQAASYEQIKAAERERSPGPLVAALDNRDGRIREAAVTALGRLGDQRATEPLLNALHDEDPFVRAAAVEALPRVLRPETALPPLIGTLGDDEQLVRARAAEALGQLGAPGAVEPLLALLRREAPGSWPQRAAATALERLGAGEARAGRRSPLTSPLALWIVGLALFALGVVLASASGIGLGAAAVGLVGFLLLLGARLQAARGSGRGFFYPGGELGGGEAIWLGASVDDQGGWADFGDGGGGGGGGDGGSF
jgi:hypothetical protein